MKIIATLKKKQPNFEKCKKRSITRTHKCIFGAIKNILNKKRDNN